MKPMLVSKFTGIKIVMIESESGVEKLEHTRIPHILRECMYVTWRPSFGCLCSVPFSGTVNNISFY